jgi:hypothetical protein
LLIEEALPFVVLVLLALLISPRFSGSHDQKSRFTRLWRISAYSFPAISYVSEDFRRLYQILAIFSHSDEALNAAVAEFEQRVQKFKQGAGQLIFESGRAV